MEPRHTQIEEEIETDAGILVREAYYGHPKGITNIYLVQDGRIAWEAELPMSDDVYANPIRVEGDHFQCASWNGIDCKIALQTGKITESLLTK